MSSRYDCARLKDIREREQLTADDVAEKIMRGRATYLDYEAGLGLPSEIGLARLATALNVNVHALYDPADPDDPITAKRADFDALVADAPRLTADQSDRLAAIAQGSP
jgi:transcriptional regulator with XRE-family HTH domain